MTTALVDKTALREQARETLREEALDNEAVSTGTELATEAIKKLTQEIVTRSTGGGFSYGKTQFDSLAERDSFRRTMTRTFKEIIARELN